MLTELIKKRILAAMKAGNRHERDTLKVALGDIQTAENRDGKTLSDEQGHAVIKKVIKGNREMIDLVKDPEVITRLETEVTILSSLLPQTLSAEQIVEQLAPVAQAIRDAGNDGQATGVAMKHLKSGGHAVEGQTVAAAVRSLRSS